MPSKVIRYWSTPGLKVIRYLQNTNNGGSDRQVMVLPYRRE
jgi:hypothetical protein